MHARVTIQFHVRISIPRYPLICRQLDDKQTWRVIGSIGVGSPDRSLTACPLSGISKQPYQSGSRTKTNIEVRISYGKKFKKIWNFSYSQYFNGCA